MNYVEALDHPELFGRWFSGSSWRAWRVIERAIFGLPIEAEDDLALFAQMTARGEAPTEPAREAWIIAGRRTAKSRKAATIGTYMATIGAEVLGYREHLAPGERGVVLILAVDRDQAQITLDYARALIAGVPMFQAMVESDNANGIELTNRMSLVVAANSFRSIRGRTLATAIFDEVAYWRSESTLKPDIETYRATRPALASMPGSLLLGIGSPYRKAGLLWQKFKTHFGKPGRVLVVRCETEVLNPLIDKDLIAQELEEDPEGARAEWLALFRDDLSDFIRVEVVQGLISAGVYERPPVSGVRYVGFVDPAGGSGQDSMTLAIAHREHELGVLDCLREVRPPFSPEGVTHEFAGVLRSYGLSSVTGDRYAGEWPREQFGKRGIIYRPSDKTKSEIYLESVPLLNGARVDLLDDKRMELQICGLERKTARGGRDSVDHAVGGHDDLANAALGACWLAAGKRVGEVSQRRLLGL